MLSGPDSQPPQKSRVRSFAPAGLLAILAVIALSVAVLYGMSGLPGKEASASGGGSCQASAARLPQITAASKGDVAAFNALKTPRPLVDISFQGPEGAAKSLSDFRGKAVLLNLWATWCVPCREEMPSLDRLQAAAGGQNFEVVAVNIDTARLDRRQLFLNDIGVKSLAFYADPSADVFQALKRAGKVVGLPTSILIDAKGCEIGALAGAAAWDSPDARRLIEAVVAPGT
ncbi:MAG: tlpA [Hyphomicrobiales bacterium]|nr:tlpA [Hyphomicrobiales bacterium]